MIGKYTIIRGNVVDILKQYEGERFHAVFCDPPYHLTSITERFGKEDSAPAKYGTDGVFQRASKGFMGQSWDGGDVAFDPETWKIIADVLYSGAFGMAFASSRGWHRLAVGIEDGGNIIHPSIFGWVQGQGFPKATRIDTQIGKAAGAERNKVFRPRPDGKKNGHGGGTFNACDVALDYESAKTPLAQVWQGHRYGAQALKPALEPIIVFQKPYSGRPIDNITQSGAGALNIDGGRIKTNDSLGGGAENSPNAVVNEEGWDRPWMHDPNMLEKHTEKIRNNVDHAEQLGRWPANFILSHHPDCKLIGTKNIKGYTINRWDDDAHPFGGGAGNDYTGEYQGDEVVEKWDCVDECPVKRLDEMSGERHSSIFKMNHPNNPDTSWKMTSQDYAPEGGYSDTGGASRFFYRYVSSVLDDADPVCYTAKASRAERDAGLEGTPLKDVSYSDYRKQMKDTDSFVSKYPDGSPRPMNKLHNSHPTIKPIGLAYYLATLLLPPPEYAPRRILVPFSGAGSEVIGALLAGWEEVVGIELIEEYVDIAEIRIDFWVSMAEKHSTKDPKKLLNIISKENGKVQKDESNNNNNNSNNQTNLF